MAPGQLTRLLEGGAWVVIVGIYLTMVRRWWWVVDDAFISFRYARNLAAGHGLRYNLGEEQAVEGYSNLGWVLVGAVVEALGGQQVLWMPVLSTLCGLGVLALLWWVCRVDLSLGPAATAAAVLALVCCPPLAVWSSSGLATVPMALALLGVTRWALLAGSRAECVVAAMWCVALLVVRTEGFAWMFVVLALAAVWRRHDGREVAPLGFPAAAGTLAWLAHLVWRWLTYGALVSNTVTAKVSFSPEVFRRGAHYSATFLTYGLPALGVLAAAVVALRRPAARPYACVGLAVPVWAAVVGGDYLPFHRFCLAALPFLTLSLAVMLDGASRRALGAASVALVVVAAAPGVPPDRWPPGVRDPLPARVLDVAPLQRHATSLARQRKLRRTGLALRRLDPPATSLVAAGIGRVGFYSEVPVVYDQFGLIDPDVAGRPVSDTAWGRIPGHERLVDGAYFLDREPDVLAFVVSGGARDPTMCSVLERWKGAPEPYGPLSFDLSEVPGRHGRLWVLRRVEDAREAWKAAEPRLERCRS